MNSFKNPARLHLATAALVIIGMGVMAPKGIAQHSAEGGVATTGSEGQIDWLTIFQSFKILKPTGSAGEYLLKQEIQFSMDGRPQGLILHAGTKLRMIAGGRILVAHTEKGNADALIPTSTITYVAIPDPKQNPDDPQGTDVRE